MKSGLKGFFFGKVDIEFLDGNMWRLLQLPASEFGIAVEGVGTIEPNAGFCFDFASIPWAIRWAYPKTGDGPTGQYGPGAIIHDWLYSYPMINGKPVDRKTVDRIFLLGMEINKVRPALRTLFYLAVRAGGGRYFGKPDKLNKLRGA
jgi:hypothetical protein